jgi:hypothetical protein
MLSLITPLGAVEVDPKLLFSSSWESEFGSTSARACPP